MTCTICEASCKECDGGTNTDCTDCYVRFYLNSGSCLSCFGNCLTCSGPNNN